MDKSRSLDELNIELQKAQEQLNENRIIEILEQIITIHKETEDFSELVETVNKLIPLLDLHKKKEKKAVILLLKSQALFRLADYITSISVVREALQIFLKSNMPLQAARCYNIIGNAYNNLGKYEDSLTNLLKSVEIYSGNENLLEKSSHRNDKIKLAETYQFIGHVYNQMNQQDRSREYCLKALQIFRDINFLKGIAYNLINLGVSYSKENPEKTLNYYKQALKFTEQTNDHGTIAVNISNIGGVYEDLEQYDNALQYYFRALSYAEKYNIIKYKPFFFEYIGSVYLKKNEFDQAGKYLKQSLKLFQDQKVPEEIKNNYELLSKVYEEKNDYKTALKFHKDYSRISNELLNKEMVSKLAGLQKKYAQSSSKIVELKRKYSLISDTLQKNIEMEFIGKSQRIKRVLELAMTASIHPDTNVLLRGESGTGKEIIANIIHYAGSRREHPMVVINCSSIPDSLAESEFFGYKKGSFTGATTDKTGYLETADKGTLFLDEIAETPTNLQAKLLRVLENKKIKKIGADHEIKVDFRIISATNKDLSELIDKDYFRLDLLYRLNTIEIEIPPLRERPEDIEILLGHFVKKFSRAFKRKIPRIEKEVIQKLQQYTFPGNVRELKNMTEKAIILLKDDILKPEHFGLKMEKGLAEIVHEIEKPKTITEMEKIMICDTLKKTKNNMTKTAQILDISFSTLKRKMAKFQIEI